MARYGSSDGRVPPAKAAVRDDAERPPDEAATGNDGAPKAALAVLEPEDPDADPAGVDPALVGDPPVAAEFPRNPAALAPARAVELALAISPTICRTEGKRKPRMRDVTELGDVGREDLDDVGRGRGRGSVSDVAGRRGVAGRGVHTELPEPRAMRHATVEVGPSSLPLTVREFPLTLTELSRQAKVQGTLVLW